MNTSSRFAVAVHAMTAMALKGEERVASQEIAESVNTNASFIRRVLGGLRKDGLIDSQPGVGGGLRLARSPDRITLLEIYEAVEEDGLFCLPSKEPNPGCPVGAMIGPTLMGVFDRAEAAMKRELSGITLGHVMQEVCGAEPKLCGCADAEAPVWTGLPRCEPPGGVALVFDEGLCVGGSASD